MLKHETGILPEFDERREIWRLLGHLEPRQRVAWLQWCCRQVSAPAATTYVEKSDGSRPDVFNDVLSLFWGSALSMREAGEKLVEMVREEK